ncbi:carbohydrate-binding module family 13 protein [Rhizophagus irregularis DAOM 181602=DAOM 197198]|nr:carbohydrate-binding module family 13 protein [Rhizophagus irregularis DAOM 181602=DAOM 197198]
MADNKLLPKLSQNLLEILDDKEYYDITIEVGSDPYVKVFRAHMVILDYRSPYLRRILSTNKKKNDGILTNIKLPNISPEIFHVLLRYIYGGSLSLEEYDISDLIKILTSFETDSFPELQKYCTDLISKEPDKIFNSPNFSTIPERLLITLVQKDNLQMKEIQVWEHVIKWGLAQNPELPSDPTSFSKDDFNTLKHTLQQCLSFIRFHDLNPKEFSKKVLPYKRIFPKELYKELLDYFLDDDSKETLPRISNLKQTSTVDDIRRVTNSDKKPQEDISMESGTFTKLDENKQNVSTNNIKNIDSKIITFQHADIISKWINRLKSTDKPTTSYEFKLLYRDSRDWSSGFLNRFKKFHEICLNQPHTVTVVKVEGSNEILGGYNPIGWKFDGDYGVTKDSFIFSFNNHNVENYILSRVKNEKEAIRKILYLSQGPSFGDLYLFQSASNQLKISCKNTTYEKPISRINDSIILEFELFKIDI